MLIVLRILLEPFLKRLLPPAIAAVGVFVLTLIIGNRAPSRALKFSKAQDDLKELNSPSSNDNEVVQLAQNPEVQDEADLSVVEAEKLASELSSHVSVPSTVDN